MKFESFLKPSNLIRLGIVILAIIKYALDVTIIIRISNSGTIAFLDLNDPVSYSTISSVIFIFGALSIFGAIFTAALDLSSIPSAVGLVTECIFAAIIIVREALFANFIICFNMSDNSITYARYSIAFLLCIIYLSYSVTLLVENRSESSHGIVKIIRFLVILGVIIAIIILNSYAAALMKPSLKKEINPSTIQIGYFSPSEVKLLESGRFNKDSSYQSRIVGSLGDLLYSPVKTLIYERCYYDSNSYSSNNNNNYGTYSCDRFYLRTLYVEFPCSGKNLDFFKDCVNATSIAVKVKYNELGGYPSYNCAVKRPNKCTPGCDELSNANYMLMFIQSNENYLEYAWNGFCNCGKKQPRVDLIKDEEIYACKSNAQMQKASFLVLLLIFLQIKK